MKAMILGSVVLAIAGGSGLAHAIDPPAVDQTAATCVYRDEPSTANSPVTKSSVKLLAVSPADGGDVRRDTLIAFDVEYSIKDFAADSFFLMPLFKTAGDGSAGPDAASDLPRLVSAAGHVHLCVRLGEMYETPVIEWPLSIRLGLFQSMPGGSNMMLTSLRSVKFKSLDIPEGALAKQAERPPIEYYDNLKKVWEYFEARLARYKACNQRFPEKQAALTKAYRSWEARHADSVQFVSELQFDQYLLTSNDNTAQATYIFDAVRAATLRGYSEMPVETLRQQCALIQSEFSDPEDVTDIVIGDELAALRKWHTSHEKATKP